VRRVDDPEKTNPVINGWLTFMCYNLGADPDYGDPEAQKAYVPYPNTGSSTDRTVYGDIYQWGRIDDGHQRPDLTAENVWPSDHFGQTTGLTPDPVPNTNINTSTGQVLVTDVRFGKFIRRNSGNYDWIDGSSDVFNNRWTDGQKAPSDPCPAGWRVPTRTEWASIYGQIDHCTGPECCANAKVNQWVHNLAVPPAGESGTHGISLTPSTTNGSSTGFGTSPTLFLPAGGDRGHDHAAVNGSGSYSSYWSSSAEASSVNAYSLACNTSYYVHPNHPHRRSHGVSVRCVSE
jgi:uncharacterized protein (TIGR02145 family)